MNQVQPLSLEVLNEIDAIPNGILSIMNELIKKNWNGTCSIIRVNEALGYIYLLANYPPKTVRRNRWMESMKEVYSNAGYRITEIGSGGDKCLEFTRGV